MDPKQLVVPASQRRFYDTFHFAPAVRAGELLLCAGQIGVGPDGRPPADPETQFVAAFEQVRAVLAEAGLDFPDVVELTTFHVGLEHLRVFGAVKDRYLAAPYPAWTAIGVGALAFPGGLVEVKVTAQLRRAKTPAKRKTRAPRPRKAKRKGTRRPARRAARGRGR